MASSLTGIKIFLVKQLTFIKKIASKFPLFYSNTSQRGNSLDSTKIEARNIQVILYFYIYFQYLISHQVLSIFCQKCLLNLYILPVSPTPSLSDFIIFSPAYALHFQQKFLPPKIELKSDYFSTTPVPPPLSLS